MRLLGLMCAAMVAGSGCSYAFQEKPARTASTPGSCSDSRIFPVIDTVVSAAGMIASGALLAHAWSDNHESLVLPAGSGVFASFLVFGSARAGYGWASQCEQGVPAGVAQR